MDTRGYQQYKEQSINTMTPGELLVLLYDELVKRLLRGELALGQQNYPLFEESIDACMAILRHLDDTLDMEYPISMDLHRLYDFFLYELNRVKFGRNGEELLKIKPMISDLRNTFRTAAKNAAEGEQGVHPNIAPMAASLGDELPHAVPAAGGQGAL
jgi:flagellar protein FliS